MLFFSRTLMILKEELKIAFKVGSGFVGGWFYAGAYGKNIIFLMVDYCK